MPESNVLDLRHDPVSPAARMPGRTEILIRHLLARLCQNEMLSIDGDMSRALQTAWAMALPQLFATLMSFPVYHQPLGAPARGYWPQAGDHYFFITYALFVMGAVAVYSWDVLFPDAMDVFVLVPLPLPARQLLSSRIVAVAIFLAAALVGTNALGIFFFPLAADQPHIGHHILAHFTAVVFAGTFACTLVLSIQGILLTLISERLFQKITPFLQILGMLILFTLLSTFPLVVGALQTVLISSAHWSQWFPPFWFLGIYQRIMYGSAPPFDVLAMRGIIATFITAAITCITYPIAYRRKVRLVMEGSAATTQRRGIFNTAADVIIPVVVRNSIQRGVYRFIGQTLWRSRRPRAMIAIFLSIGLALAFSNLITINSSGIHFRHDGALVSVAIIAFWLTFGLRAAFASPVDLRGSWVFRSILGREKSLVLDVQKHWTVYAVLFISAALAIAFAVAGAISITRLLLAVLICTAVAILTTDFYGRHASAIPFTQAMKTTQHERPLAAARYLLVFPFLMTLEVRWMHMSFGWLSILLLAMYLLHRYLIRAAEEWRANDFDGNLDDSDPDEFPTSLGLRE
ncbi:hypothetical protein [Terriglobus albidus]|uniref:hypothetical protein n=1 Tax=Terriglobus albidus TaxID=1592106 RepID=UPI0021E09485|nr:hypothetical protein [Terriglobus albidus]